VITKISDDIWIDTADIAAVGENEDGKAVVYVGSFRFVVTTVSFETAILWLKSRARTRSEAAF